MKVFMVGLNMVLGICIPLALQFWDRGKLAPKQQKWVWNFASWGSAVYNFGPLSLVAWGYITRSPRYWLGLLHGVLLAEVAVFVQAFLSHVVGLSVKLKPKDLNNAFDGFVAEAVVVVALAVVIGLGRTVYEAVRRARAPSARGA